MMDMLTQQKIEIVVDLATKGMRQEIAELKTKNDRFQSEIASLRSELQGLRSSRPAFVQDDAEPQQRLVAEPPVQAAPKHNLDQPIDRNGVAPSSVSIEKMFYCGNKRF